MSKTVALITGNTPPPPPPPPPAQCDQEHESDDPRVSEMDPDRRVLVCARLKGHEGDHWDSSDHLSWRVEVERE